LTETEVLRYLFDENRMDSNARKPVESSPRRYLPGGVPREDDLPISGAESFPSLSPFGLKCLSVIVTGYWFCAFGGRAGAHA
jgi:hypothetical protein